MGNRVGLRRYTNVMTRRQTIPSPATPPGSTPRYRDRIYDDARHDPYRAKGKYQEPAACTGCGAIFEGGRWRWSQVAANARPSMCPACARIRDALPAGYVSLSGPFFEAHRLELLRLVRNTAAQERAEHPLHRIMQILEDAEQTLVTTSDVHSARRIGEALKHAYDGDLDIGFGHDEYSVRVSWRR